VLHSRFIVTLTLGASVGLAASVSFAQAGRASSAPAAAPSAAPATAAAAPTASSSPQPSGASSTPEGGGVAVAQEHLQSALVHFRQHQYTEAIHEFELANAAAPSADFWFNIARCHELLSHYDVAIDYYLRYLRDKVDPRDRAQVQQHINELRQSAEIARNAARRQNVQAAIRFELGNNVPSAALFIADRRVGQGSLTSPFPVTPGTYPVRVTADGMQDWRASVRVRQGETVTAFVGLQPATQYRTRSGGHIASYVLGAASILALGAGIALGAFAATQSPCMGDPVAMMADANCDRRDWATRADILYGVGAGLVLTTAIVYFIEAGASRTERVQRRTAFNR
jgi:hypothetical protein